MGLTFTFAALGALLLIVAGAMVAPALGVAVAGVLALVAAWFASEVGA